MPPPPQLLVTGFALLALAFMSLVGVAVSQVGGYDWPDEAVVPLDGRSHTVGVDRGRDVLLWTEGGGQASSCSVVDETSGEPLEARPIDDGHRRAGGAADWVAVAVVEPSSTGVRVTCAEEAPTFVAVQSAPRVPGWLSVYSAWSAVPAGLAVTGLALLVVGVAGVVRRRRPAQPSPSVVST